METGNAKVKTTLTRMTRIARTRSDPREDLMATADSAVFFFVNGPWTVPKNNGDPGRARRRPVMPPERVRVIRVIRVRSLILPNRDA